jgi:hypothetical protein
MEGKMAPPFTVLAPSGDQVAVQDSVMSWTAEWVFAEHPVAVDTVLKVTVANVVCRLLSWSQLGVTLCAPEVVLARFVPLMEPLGDHSNV